MNRRYDQRTLLASSVPMTCLLLTVGICTAKQAPVAMEIDPRLSQQIQTLEHQMMSATLERNIAVLDRLLAEEFRLSGAPLLSEEDFITKEQYLESVQHTFQLLSFAFEDVEISQYGPVVMVHSRLHWNGRLPHRIMEGSFFMSDVWVKQDACWKLVSRHMSRLGRSGAERFRSLKQLIL